MIRTGSDFGRTVADLRAVRGLTQNELAERVGITRSYLAKLEAGLSVVLLDRVLRTLRRLGAEVTVSVKVPDDRG